MYRLQRHYYYGRTGRNWRGHFKRLSRLTKTGYVAQVIMAMRDAGVPYWRRNIITEILEKLHNDTSSVRSTSQVQKGD